MAKEVVVTREGYDKLVHDLDELRTVKRKEVADKIKVARGYGDLSENAEYDAAKEEQAVVEARIADLEATLKVARVIDDSELSGDTVSIGMNVTIQEEGEEPESYDITGSTEADMNLNRISDESPVGAALIGHKPGDEVDVTLPNGSIVDLQAAGPSPAPSKRKPPHIHDLKTRKDDLTMEQNKPQTEQDISQQAAVRRQKLADLRAAGSDPFVITKYPQDSYSADLKAEFADLPAEAETGKIVSPGWPHDVQTHHGQGQLCPPA